MLAIVSKPISCLFLEALPAGESGTWRPPELLLSYSYKRWHREKRKKTSCGILEMEVKANAMPINAYGSWSTTFCI
jgi:hypothetical protein